MCRRQGLELKIGKFQQAAALDRLISIRHLAPVSIVVTEFRFLHPRAVAGFMRGVQRTFCTRPNTTRRGRDKRATMLGQIASWEQCPLRLMLAADSRPPLFPVTEFLPSLQGPLFPSNVSAGHQIRAQCKHHIWVQHNQRGRSMGNVTHARDKISWG